MEKKGKQNELIGLLEYLPTEWSNSIKKQDQALLQKATELRFRLERGCSLSCGEKNYMVPSVNVTKGELEFIMEKLFQGAAYRFEHQIENGYISLPGGHRVGLCGSFVTDEKGKIRVHDISSLNFRICREKSGVAERLYPKLLCDGRFCSTLIVSEPCGGKTTLLTELAKKLSNEGYRCAIIDERSEIASMYQGISQKDVGELADVLDGYPKPYGMMIALRTLSPQVIICDEIGSAAETDRMIEAMNAGVPILASAHARDEEELFNRPQIDRLLRAGVLSKIVILKGAAEPGRIRKVMTVNHYDDEDYWSSDDC